MSDLANKICISQEHGSPTLSQQEAEQYIKQLTSDWLLSDDNKSISCTYRFNNYYETMAFVNVVAMVAHQQNHHPNMAVSYNTCNVKYSTHSIGGLSINDFICAAKIDTTLEI